MSALIDPRVPGLIDAVGLALTLGGMDDDGLWAAEQGFRLAGEGWEVRVGGGDFVRFDSEGTRMVAAAIAWVIAAHREAAGAEALGRIGRAHQRWVGDWLNYGERALAAVAPSVSLHAMPYGALPPACGSARPRGSACAACTQQRAGSRRACSRGCASPSPPAKSMRLRQEQPR